MIGKALYPSKNLEKILKQVPPDYYQRSTRTNLGQKIWHKNRLNIVYETLKNGNKNPKNILDVGSASGWFLFEISKLFPNARCYGIDLYREAVVYGRKKYKKLELAQANAHSLPFHSAFFDAVICCSVLEHVEFPDRVVKEIKRVLKPGGVAVVEIDTDNWLFKILWFWWTNMRNGVWKNAHIHPSGVRQLEKIFIKNGFKIEKRKMFNFSMQVVFLLRKKKV